MKKSCTEYALNYLHLYPKTEKELTAKLLEKGYSEQEVANTIMFLKSKQYVDDRQFCQLYVQSELVKKGKPLYVVRSKLIQKWAPKDVLESVLEEYSSDIKEGIHERIKKEIQKMKSKSIEGFDIINKLMRKGYKLDDIKRVVKSQSSQ